MCIRDRASQTSREGPWALACPRERSTSAFRWLASGCLQRPRSRSGSPSRCPATCRTYVSTRRQLPASCDSDSIQRQTLFQ
eukprot:2083123-Rhodomonas_salina.2